MEGHTDGRMEVAQRRGVGESRRQAERERDAKNALSYHGRTASLTSSCMMPLLVWIFKQRSSKNANLRQLFCGKASLDFFPFRLNCSLGLAAEK